jgi:hypothetical protein
MGDIEVHAMFDYVPAEDTPGHLTLRKGDIVRVNLDEQEHTDWWTGTMVMSDATGLFPAAYVSRIDMSEAFTAVCLYDFAGEHVSCVFVGFLSRFWFLSRSVFLSRFLFCCVV